MKKLYVFPVFLTAFLLIQFGALRTYALNYTISFTGTGVRTSVESVIVQNLTKGTTVTVPTGNYLNLSDVTTSIDKVPEMKNGISIYPNPMQEKSTVSFFVKQTGITQINFFDIDGRKIICLSKTLLQGDNSFQFSIPQGTYALQVRGDGFSYNTKVISQMNYHIKPQISFLGNEKQSIDKPKKSKNAATTMIYNDGDQLLYKGISGNYTTIVTDKPTSSKTTNFNFVECRDGDGNYYAVVTIGTQTWMAENLKTTKYNDGITIPLITDNASWVALSTSGYCWYRNDPTVNKTIYGALYNWYSVNNTKLAPIGWHIPTDEEWTRLENYLINNGYNYDSSTTENKYAKSFAANIIWPTDSYVGSIGNDLQKNNSSGFSALPAGSRYNSNGSFIGLTISGGWWSSTYYNSYLAWRRGLDYNLEYMYRDNVQKQCGFSVRCIKN